MDQTIPEAEWEVVVRETANLIIEQQSPQRWVWLVGVLGSISMMCVYRLLDVRSRLYDLLKHCIPPEVVFKVGWWSVCVRVHAG